MVPARQKQRAQNHSGTSLCMVLTYGSIELISSCNRDVCHQGPELGGCDNEAVALQANTIWSVSLFHCTLQIGISGDC